MEQFFESEEESGTPLSRLSSEGRGIVSPWCDVQVRLDSSNPLGKPAILQEEAPASLDVCRISSTSLEFSFITGGQNWGIRSFVPQTKYTIQKVVVYVIFLNRQELWSRAFLLLVSLSWKSRLSDSFSFQKNFAFFIFFVLYRRLLHKKCSFRLW